MFQAVINFQKKKNKFFSKSNFEIYYSYIGLGGGGGGGGKGTNGATERERFALCCELYLRAFP